MKEPPYLTIDTGHGLVLIDEADFIALGRPKIRVSARGYPYVWRGRSGPLLLHREILPGSTYSNPVDHREGDKLDCRRASLRRTTNQVNQANRKRLNKNNTSGVRGVRKRAGPFEKPWIAQISIGGKGIHLGVFATEAEAVTARKAAELRYFGEHCPA